MFNLEKPEKAILIILTAALLIGIGILTYHKCRPVGNLHINFSGTEPESSGRNISKKSDKININEASAKELANLKGIGAVLAERVVDYRTKNGSFISPDDLKRVPGIGDALLKKIKNDITIE